MVLLEMQMQQEKIRRVHQVVGLDFNVEWVPLVGCSRGIVIFFIKAVLVILSLWKLIVNLFWE